MRAFWGKIGKFIKKILIWFVIISVSVTILYRWVNPPITFLMISRSIYYGYPIKKDWVPIQDISQKIIDCAVASEDNWFLAHNGIDFGAVKKAIEHNKKNKNKRGASTISQQTAKNVFLWESRSWVRKGFEVYFTCLIELFWSKERIIEVYLNVIEMGKGIYGIQSASQYYFGKSADRLSNQQSALIIASLPAPRKYNPAKPSNYLYRRANNILILSRKIGKIYFDKESIKKAEKRYSIYKKRKK